VTERNPGTIIGPAPSPADHPMAETLGRLYTPGEIAALECIRCLYISLIRKRAVDPQLADDLCARAMAAIEEGGSAVETLARWVPIQQMAETVMNPDAWPARPAPLLPGLTHTGGEGLPATLTWPPGGRRSDA
jgi:hypothetical protein